MVANNVFTDCGFKRQFLNDRMVKKTKIMKLIFGD